MSDYQFIDRLREGIPPEVEEGDSLEQLREFSQWMLIVPLIMLIIFGCGQLALVTTPAAAVTESGSSLIAEYGPWSYVPIRSVSGEIVNAIRQDLGRDENSADVYNDPVEVMSEWVEGELPPVIIARLPSGEPDPTRSSGGGAPDPGGSKAPTQDPISTNDPHATSDPSPTFTLIPTNTEPVPPTATLQPTSTDNPAATRTPTPIPSNTPTSPPPTIPSGPTSTPIPSNTPTRTPAPTNTPTRTPMPTNTSPPVTDTPPPPLDYCANISWNSLTATDVDGRGTVIRFSFTFKNNNSIPMSLTSYTLYWDPGIGLNRAKTIRYSGDSTRPRLITNHGSSPRSCEGCPQEYPGQPGTQQEIYNMFCKNVRCTESDPNLEKIDAGTYSFTATGNFSFNSGATNCSFTKSKSITLP